MVADGQPDNSDMKRTTESRPDSETGLGHEGVYVYTPVSSPVPNASKPVRILLSESASKALLEVGECFVIAGKSSLPDQPGRIALHFVPIPKEQADAACHVAMGTHRAVKKTT